MGSSAQWTPMLAIAIGCRSLPVSTMTPRRIATADAARSAPARLLLPADRMFDGDRIQGDWAVLVGGQSIEAVGDANSLGGAGIREIDMADVTV